MKKYLKTGQEIVIEAQTETEVFVRPIMIIEDYENNFEYEGEIIKVKPNEIFDKPPIEKINSEVKEKINELYKISDAIIATNKELSKINYELAQAKKTQISNEKFIINRSELLNAKTLVLFPSGRIEPMRLESGNFSNFRGLMISLSVSVYNGEESSWGYKLYFDSGYNVSEHLSKENGFLINPTEEEIMEICFKRQNVSKFDDWTIKRTDDKYLTPENIIKKQELIKSDNEVEIVKLENEIKQKTEQLNKLKEIICQNDINY
jgi:hypothetical protein